MKPSSKKSKPMFQQVASGIADQLEKKEQSKGMPKKKAKKPAQPAKPAMPSDNDGDEC